MRHRKLLAPINTEKHYFNHPAFTLAAGAIAQIEISDAVTVAAKSGPNEVEEGSLIKAIYNEYWLTTDGTGQGSAIVVIEKVPSGATPMTFAQSNALGTYPNKKNIFFTFEGLTPPNTQNPVPILRNWLKIPKGKQRQGLGDKLIINFSSIVGGLSVCGFDLYKEWK